MLKNNKMLYGLLILFVGLAMSFNTATAQVTGEQETETQQQNMLEGKVVDASNGQALSNVTVEVEGQDQEATTDEEGKFTIENLGQQGQDQEQGMGIGGDDITIRINHDGYQELTETISLDELRQGGQQEQGQQQQQGMQEEEDVRTFELEPEEGGQDQEQGMPPLL